MFAAHLCDTCDSRHLQTLLEYDGSGRCEEVRCGGDNRDIHGEQMEERERQWTLDCNVEEEIIIVLLKFLSVISLFLLEFAGIHDFLFLFKLILRIF